MRQTLLWLPLFLAACAGPVPATTAPGNESRHLLLVIDGLRPDYVTEAVMPNLSALGKRGVTFTRHHSVYPTVTRVNASAYSTGAYPERHGILGNSVFFPKVNPVRFLDTASRADLESIAAAEGRLLTATTLGESLQEAGRRMLVVSSGSAGSAVLNNHTVAGGAILHPQFTIPESLGEAMKRLGPVPGEGAAPGALDRYAVDAFLKVGLPLDPSVTVLWLAGLDSTAHVKGVGAPETVAVLKHVDDEIRRIEDGLKAAGVLEAYNIWIASDHGFSTYSGAPDVRAVMKPFAGALPDGSPRIVSSGGAIYVRDRDQPTIAAIVAALQRTAGIGAIFTAASQPGSLGGAVPGTLSFDAARWAHDRSGQILYSPDWNDSANAHGFPGTTTAGGTAGHGSASPWDIRNTLIAAGPDLNSGLVIDTPSANVDVAPTFMKLLGITPPSSVQGRPLAEALRAGAPAASVKTEEFTARTGDGQYAVTAMFSIVTAGDREYRYLDGTRVVRR